MIIMEQYLTPEEVAEKLRLHPETVKRLLRQGKLPGYKIEGSWRVNAEDLQEWMKQRKNQAE